MNKFAKSMLALSISGAVVFSVANAATYQIIDKGDVPTLKYTYSQQENNLSEMAISGTTVYNFPVQYQYLKEEDFDNIVRMAQLQFESVHELGDIEDEAALRGGNPTANDLSWVVRYLKSKSGSSLYQKVGDIVAMTNVNGQTQEITIFDQPFEGSSTLSRSTVDYINGITDDGWIYGSGSAPYTALDFTESDGDQVTHWKREFGTRGYFSPDKGQTIIPLIPPESTYGGESAILDISENKIAVGFASVSIDQEAIDFINDETGGCADPNVLDDLPFEICVQRIVSGIYDTQAFKWQLDASGIVSAEPLGLLVTPHEDDKREYISYAQAVNAQGVAVGYSHGWWDENEVDPSVNEARQLYAVVFKDGKVIDFTDDHSEMFDSRAYDINDRGIAIGHVKKYSNGSLREKFYYVDTSVADMSMVLPTDFFTGASSSARSINENNLIVGDGEVETHNDSAQNPRRTHGFLYDIELDSFTDLNDYLPCNSQYTIIEARNINNNNEISATAILKTPRRDAKGELMVDSNGTQLFEDVVRAVKMIPITGEIEDCSQVEEKVERQGASTGILSLFAMLTFGLRRRVFNR